MCRSRPKFGLWHFLTDPSFFPDIPTHVSLSLSLSLSLRFFFGAVEITQSDCLCHFSLALPFLYPLESLSVLTSGYALVFIPHFLPSRRTHGLPCVRCICTFFPTSYKHLSSCNLCVSHINFFLLLLLLLTWHYYIIKISNNINYLDKKLFSFIYFKITFINILYYLKKLMSKI